MNIIILEKRVEGRYKFGAGEVMQYALSLRSFDESYDGVNTLMEHKFSDGP